MTATLTATSFHTGVITSLAMKLLRGREGMTSPKAAEPANAPTPDGPCPSRRSPGRLLPRRAPVPLAPAPLRTRRALPVSLLFSPPRCLPSLGARGLSAAGRTVCVLSSGCERPCAPELGAAVSPGSRATVPGVPQRGGSAGLCRLRSRPADEPQPASLGQAACPRAGAWGGAQGERAEALHLETRFQTGRPSSSLCFSGLAAVQGFSNYCGRSSRKTDRLHRVSPVTVKAEALMSSC